MQRAQLPIEPIDCGSGPGAKSRFIYIACPWSPAGGGMFKVADYLISGQRAAAGAGYATLRPLDTRGAGSAVASLLFLAVALFAILRGRLGGRLAGVHVNMAERMSLVRKGAVVVTCWLLRVPVVIHLHGEMRRFFQRLPAPAQGLTRWMFSRAAGVVVIGATARRFVTEELGVPQERVDVVENGVPGPAAAPVRASGEAQAAPRVLFVGRLCDAKGVVDLLEGAARASRSGTAMRLTLVGGGSETDRYAQLAASLGIASFTEFAGWCDEERVSQLLSEAALLVLPSHDEVLPLVVLEALAHGVPVLCTPVGELPHAFKDGVHVRFVPLRDPGALAAALQETLADPELLRRLSANGRRTYEERYSMERFFSRIAAVHGARFGTSAEAAVGYAEPEVSA